MKIALVVDDIVYNRELFARHLESLGFKVLHAGNGQEALEILRRTKVSVLLLDHFMPIMTGLDLLQAIALEFPDFATPVIMMSTTQSINRLAVAERGAWDWVEKPASLAAIRAVLQRVGVFDY
ncbi:MAG: response regulator [Pseudomonadota bacterium]